MVTTNRWMTAEELLTLPEDHVRHELVRGVLRTMSPAGDQHGRITMNVSTPLDVHVRSRRLGFVYTAETGFRLASNPDTVLAADVAFLRRERSQPLGGVQGYRTVAPDLVVEIVSPSDRPREIVEKVAMWLGAGTALVLVAYPRTRTVAAHRPGQPVETLTDADTIDGGEVVPGWRMPVGDVFADPLAD